MPYAKSLRVIGQSLEVAKLPAFDPTGTLKSLTFADANYWAAHNDEWTKQWNRISKGA